MANDPFTNPPDASNPYSSPTAENKPSSLPPLQTGLGSLGQEARLKHLNTAKWILIVVGILTIGVNVLQYTTVEAMIDRELTNELKKQRIGRQQVDPVAYNQVRDAAIRRVRVLCMALIGLGIVYIVMGMLVKKYPVPLTIAGLVLYVGTALVFFAINPASLAQGGLGIVVKIVIVVAMVKAILAALAYERERKAAAALEFGA